MTQRRHGVGTLSRKEAENQAMEILSKIGFLTESYHSHQQFPRVAKTIHHEILRLETQLIELERRLGIEHEE